MAVLTARLFRFHAVPTWPQRFGARLVIYVAMTLGAWLLPPWGALIALAAVFALGWRIHWGPWLRSLGWLWLFILAPLLAALVPPLPSKAELLPAAYRCLTFLALLSASQWLSASSTVYEIRAALSMLFRPFGRRVANFLSLGGALALCFIPWVLEQMDAVRQAGELRGVPSRKPLLALRALSIPVFVRMIEKARHTAEALELRGQ
jgi:energy-coupling factor transporter transmembrane protein EcfT